MKQFLSFLTRVGGWVVALAVLGRLGAADLSSQVAIQTWTLRNLNFEQVVEFAKRHGIRDLQMIDKHLSPKASPEEIRARKAVLDQAGLRVYTFGVAGTSMNPEENRKLFEFAKTMGIQLIVVEPSDFRILDNLEQLVKEYDIRIAIHNHGLKSLYGNPVVVRQLIGHRDPRVGVCLDVGWVTSANFDAAQIFRDYQGRVFDIHLKDKMVKKTEKGDDVAVDTHIGEGQANYRGLFKALTDAGYTGRLAIETDSQDFARQPDEFVAKAKAFVAANSKSEVR